MLKRSITAPLLSILLSISVASQAAVDLPEIGTVGASSLTIEKEKEYGWAFRMMATQALPIIHDPVLNEYINDMGQNIVSHADSVRMPFYFYLVEDDEINAAAFLGGNVKIHSGLFLYADNESELAGVVAHEVAHITQRHLARMLEQQSLSNPASMAALAGSILLSLVSPAAGLAALNTTIAVNMQSQINYTRLHEFEADRIGINTLYNAGYNPYGMSDFFSKLSDKYQYATLPPQLLSTHPLPDTRVAEARLRAGQLQPKKINSNLSYQLSKSRISVRYTNIGAVASTNYYQSQLRNNTYKLKEAAQYGLALSHFKGKKYSEALALAKQLHQQRPDNLFYLDFMTDALMATDQTEQAVALLTPYQQQSPQNSVLTLNLVVALQALKRYAEAEKLLERFIRVQPEHILAHQVAIKLYEQMALPAKEHAFKAQYLALKGRFREASQEMGTALVYAQSHLDQARYSASIEFYKQQDLRLKALQR